MCIIHVMQYRTLPQESNVKNIDTVCRNNLKKKTGLPYKALHHFNVPTIIFRAGPGYNMHLVHEE